MARVIFTKLQQREKRIPRALLLDLKLAESHRETRPQGHLTAHRVDERSFSPADIPKQFFLVGYFSAAHLDGFVYERELKGVEGISGSWRIAEKFLDSQGRNMVLMMPGPATARVNKLSRVMYDNPHYLAQDDLAAVKRIAGHTNSTGAYFADLLTGHLQSVIRKEYPDFKFEVKSKSDWVTPWGFWNRQSGIEIQNLSHLTKLWREWGVRQARFPASTDAHKAAAAKDHKAWMRWVGQALVNKYGGNFKGEAEWRVKDGKLKVPEGSRLVLLAKGHTEANAKLLKEFSGGLWNDDNVTLVPNRAAGLALLSKIAR